MIDPDRAERDDEGPLEDIDIDDDAPAIVIEYARAHGYRPAHPRVLPPARFSDARAEPWQCKMINARTAADETGPRSATVRMRLTSSCAGWKQRPTGEEFFEAIRAETLTGMHETAASCWTERLCCTAKGIYGDRLTDFSDQTQIDLWVVDVTSS